MNWIMFKGVKSSDLGVGVESMPAHVRPRLRSTVYKVAGRDGELTITDGCYEPITLKCTLNMLDAQTIDYIDAWLSGAGDLVTSDDPARCYKAIVLEELTYARLRTVSGRKLDSISVNFRCQPHRYEVAPASYALSNATLANAGTAPAYPTLQIKGNGSGSVTINGETMEFTGLSTSKFLVVDSTAGKAYFQGTSGSAGMSGNFPVLATGNNTIALSGISAGIITPNWRWI